MFQFVVIGILQYVCDLWMKNIAEGFVPKVGIVYHV